MWFGHSSFFTLELQTDRHARTHIITRLNRQGDKHIHKELVVWVHANDPELRTLPLSHSPQYRFVFVCWNKQWFFSSSVDPDQTVNVQCRSILVLVHTVCPNTYMYVSQLGLDSRKLIFGGLRTTKTHTSMRMLRADWSAHLSFAFSKLATRNFDLLGSLCRWGDWFEARFVGNPEDKFCRVEAQLMLAKIIACPAAKCSQLYSFWPSFIFFHTLCLWEDRPLRELCVHVDLSVPLVIYKTIMWLLGLTLRYS